MKVLRHGKAIEMTDKTVWGAPQFADLALRLKSLEAHAKEVDIWRVKIQDDLWKHSREISHIGDVEGRLDKLERPWVEAREQRQREIDAGKTAGDRGKAGLNASITDLLEEIVRLEQSREELRLHVKAREGEIEQLRAANNQMLERLRAGAANFEKMLG